MNTDRETEARRPEPGYSLLSTYRSELMGLAMVWVMLFHAWPWVLTNELADEIKNLGFGGVDIFIMLSAMGLVMSRLKRPAPYGVYMKKRLVRILPAYYLVVIPFTLWKISLDAIPKSALFWNVTLLGYWRQAEGAFNWYVPGIMVFYLILPAVVILYRKLGRWSGLFTAVIAAADVALCQWLVVTGYWAYLDFLYRIPVFFIGVWIGCAVYDKKKMHPAEILLWIVMGVGTIFFLNWKETLATYVPNAYAFVLLTVPLCLLLGLLMRFVPIRPLMWLLRQFGTCSLEIYLINVSFFNEFQFFCGPHGWKWDIYCMYAIPVNLALGIALHYARTWAWKGITAVYRKVKS